MKAFGPAAGFDAVDRLAHALGITNRATARALAGFGVEPVSALLVTWIPAVELAWIGGLTQVERRRLIGLVHGRHANLPDGAERLLGDWLSRRPNSALFRVGRRVLHAQLAALPPAERPALIARVVDPCRDLADVSGGLLGFAAVCADERDWLLMLERELAVHGSEGGNTGSDVAASASSASDLLLTGIRHLRPVPPRSRLAGMAARARILAAWLGSQLAVRRGQTLPGRQQQINLLGGERAVSHVPLVHAIRSGQSTGLGLMMKMTGNASTIAGSTRAWCLMAGIAVVFALFWETRALVTVQIIEVPAERVLHMAETGTIRWARIGGGTLIVAAVRPHNATATSRLREAAGLPADGRLFLVRPATAADLVVLRAAIERHAVDVR